MLPSGETHVTWTILFVLMSNQDKYGSIGIKKLQKRVLYIHNHELPFKISCDIESSESYMFWKQTSVPSTFINSSLLNWSNCKFAMPTGLLMSTNLKVFRQPFVSSYNDTMLAQGWDNWMLVEQYNCPKSWTLKIV